MPYCGLYNRDMWPTSCNLNLYEDGSQAVGWHADDELLFRAVDEDAAIVSLSLGASRAFQVKIKGASTSRQLTLKSGDILVMLGKTQKHYSHRVPSDISVTQPRINLTWRWIRQHQAGCPAHR